MKITTKIASLMAIIGVVSIVVPAYPGGQLNQQNGGGVLIGEHWELSTALANRTPGDGRTIEIYFGQGTAADRIAAIQASHTSWENVVAIDFDDVANTLPHAPSNGAGGGTPDGFNTHSFEFTLGCTGGLGVTPTITNATTGQIVEADVFYESTACVVWSTDGTPAAGEFELEAVAVHEMGHFVGLSHSGDVDATMFPSIAPGTTAVASLEPDDESSVTNVYSQDVGDVLVPSGGISGRIIDGTLASDGKVCALVYAFSVNEAPITTFNQAAVQVYSGSVIGATAASNTTGASSGSYEINGLPDGDWFVLLDPIGNLVTAGQISSWCGLNSEAGFPQEWWNGVAESGAEGCLTCSLAVTVSGGQITTGIDIFTETGICVTTETPEVSCADGVDNDCNGFADCDDANCAANPACTGGCTLPAECDDGLFCNGAEDCVAGSCVTGTPPNCNDGVACTDDSCNEATDSCDNFANNAICDNGLFCDSSETCDAALGCLTGADPCPGQSCDEAGDFCFTPPTCDNNGVCNAGEDCNSCPADCFSGAPVTPACGNGICETFERENCKRCPQDCAGQEKGGFCCGDLGDGDNPVGCEDPRCSEGGFACSAAPVTGSCCGDTVCEGTETEANCAVDCGAGCVIDADCNDGLFCNGAETCVGGLCQSGTTVNCDDGVACTDDSCNEVSDSCDNVANDGNCDDGLFCNGDEACQAGLGCLAGAAPCLPGDVCLEGSDTCCVPSAEICTDAVDNDCDGFTDCNDADCAADPACAAPFCGDAFCDPGEDQCNCSQDCGAPPASELNCADGVDEDCDGLTDCDDPDCSADPACAACTPKGDPCSTHADCCDGRCREKNGALICD